MGLHYDINQKQLKAENKFLIDHFTLGPHNESTNATHLPVKLAVALLKDRNGRIDLDIPLTGRTDDPQFKIAPLVFKVVVNLIVKAATSPFSLLGALVGGGEELSFVDFQPGRADIPDTEAQKAGQGALRTPGPQPGNRWLVRCGSGPRGTGPPEVGATPQDPPSEGVD
jgi:hypothetical protein